MDGRANEPISTVALVGCAVAGAVTIGILTRPVGFLAAIWPANAILLGLLVLYPRHARPLGWTVAALAYLLVGHLSGDAWLKNVWLTAANLAGVAIGVILFGYLDADHRRLRRAQSILYVFVVCVIASAGAAFVGSGMGPVLFGRSFSTGSMFWFTTELCNYILVLPVMLAAPRGFSWPAAFNILRMRYSGIWQIAPLAALCLSIAASIAIGGPGAIAFAVPALLWCSVAYNLFTTSIVVMLASAALLIAESSGTMILPRSYDFFDGTISFRLGVSLMAIGPLTVGSMIALQKELQARLERLANRDSLTDALNRRAYLDSSSKLLANTGRELSDGVAIVMIDIDHFKRFNDLHGHAMGDAVLVAVAGALSGQLRKTDLFGRMGGEEFAITLANVSRQQSEILSERFRRAVEELTVVADDNTTLGVTISVGLVHCAWPSSSALQVLLPCADAALYRAKASGRNRVQIGELHAKINHVSKNVSAVA